MKQLVKLTKGCFQGIQRKRSAFQGGHKLVQIHNLDEAIRINDDISQKIRNDHGILCFIKVIGDNIAVPVKETAVFSEKFTYLEAFLQEVTGASVMEMKTG